MLHYLQGIWLTDADLEVLRTAFVSLKANVMQWRDVSTNSEEREQFSEMLKDAERLDDIIRNKLIKNITSDQYD